MYGDDACFTLGSPHDVLAGLSRGASVTMLEKTLAHRLERAQLAGNETSDYQKEV